MQEHETSGPAVAQQPVVPEHKAKVRFAFVIGCARSGTSILGELIGSHPDVAYKHEAHAAWNKAGPGENESHRLTAAHAHPKIKRKIRKRFEAEAGEAKVFVEKCPRSMVRIPFIREIFPEAKFIHIIRDGRDVACSLMPGIGGAEWRHLKPPNWQQLFAEEQGIIRCAKLWRSVVEMAEQDLLDVDHFTIRYEELVADPEKVAGEILQYLELEPHAAVYEFCKRIQNETNNSYHANKQVKWFRNDHAVRVGRWRENLSEQEVLAVEEIVLPVLRKFGYECG